MADIISVEYEYTGGQTMSFWGEFYTNGRLRKGAVREEKTGILV